MTTMTTENLYWTESMSRHIEWPDMTRQWVKGASHATPVNQQPLPEGATRCIAVCNTSSIIDWRKRYYGFPT